MSDRSRREDGRDPPSGPLDGLPDLTRVAVGAWWRAASWSAGASLRTGSAITRRLPGGETAVQVAEGAASQARERARRLLGVTAVEKRVQDLVPERSSAPGGSRDPGERISADALRARGAGLLERSSDVEVPDEAHPAYARILDELAPDEARVLRVLALGGPQVAVNVRSGGALGMGGRTLASNLTNVGAEAGCRFVDRVPAYLNNLARLGLVTTLRGELDELRGYQVLEAQATVTDALARGGRGARTIRRGVALTPFGTDFCATCLPVDESQRPGTDGPTRGGRSGRSIGTPP